MTIPKEPREGKRPFTPFSAQMDYPTGNSFIEFLGSMVDPKWNLRTYIQTRAQNIALSIANVKSDPSSIKRMKAAPDEAVAEQPAGETKNHEILVSPLRSGMKRSPRQTIFL